MRPENWGLPPCILLVLVLWIQFFTPSEAEAAPSYGKNAASAGGLMVEGTVLCGTCLPTTSAEIRKLYLAGASVAVECPGTTIYKEAKTNNHGVFQFQLEDAHQVDVRSCSVKLVRGSSRFCNVAANTQSKGDRGRQSVYNAGAFTFHPQGQLEPCYQEPSLTEEEKVPAAVIARDQSQPLPRRLPRGSFRRPAFFPPNPLQPPSLLPPNPVTPPPSLLPPLTPPPTLLPPTPLTPSPPSLLPPNPFQPPSPPSILPRNPFQPPPSPPSSLFPPNPFRPPSPPPSSLFPPNPFQQPSPPTLLPPGPPPSILPRNPFERPPPSSILPRNPFQTPSPPGSLIPQPNPFRPPTLLPPNPPSLQQPTQPSPSLLPSNPLQQPPSLLPSNPFQQPSPLLPPLLGAPLLAGGATQPSPPTLSLGLPPFPFFPGFPPATPSPP